MEICKICKPHMLEYNWESHKRNLCVRTVSPVLRFPLNTSPASTAQIQNVSALFRMKYDTTAAMIQGELVASQPSLRSA